MRERMIESHYIKEVGNEFFVKAFGNGKGLKAARKNIMECKVMPIPIVSLDKR